MAGSRGDSGSQKLTIATNLVVITVAVLVLLRPGPSPWAWYTEWRAAAEIRAIIEDDWQDLLSGAPVVWSGKTDGPVVIEFADYQCPYCQASHERLSQDRSSSADVTVVYRHMPLTSLHPNAEHAALIAICAEQRGLFQEVHDWLYRDVSWHEQPADWSGLSEVLSDEDRAVVEGCVVSQEAQDRLAADVRLAERLQLTSTPSFVGLGGIHTGVIGESRLMEIARP